MWMVTTSMENDCPECRTLSRLVMFTSGQTPWLVRCLLCGEILVEAHARSRRPEAAVTQSAVPAAVSLGSAQRGTRTHAGSSRKERRTVPHRTRNKSMRSRIAAGAGILSACGLTLAFLAAGQDAASNGAHGGAGALEQAEADVLAPVVAHYRIAAEMMLGDREQAYPDPREGMMRLQLAAQADPEADAGAEAGLDLSPAKRREIQRRLHLAEHNPKGIDGVFGPATRTAIAAWQEQSNIPPTGYVTERTLNRLVAETDDAYHVWRVAEKARRHQRIMTAAAPVRRAEPTGCERLNSGEIAYGQNIRCDVKGLRENLGVMGKTLTRLFGSSEQSHS